MLEQGVLPFLWPDQNGNLNLNATFRAPSNGLQLPRSRRSPRGEVVRASRLLRSRFLFSWLSSKSWGVVGFGVVRRSLFETWLSAQLESCAFGGMLLGEVVSGAKAELGLDGDEVLRLLLNATRGASLFKAENGLISFR